jgi:hypothetical protein
MTSTPVKPTRTASQRIGVTRSPKTSAAPATTTRGVACRIADVVESAVRVMARP